MTLSNLSILAVLLASGCATITSGTTQVLTIVTDSPCALYRDSEELGTVTPQWPRVQVPKSAKSLTLSCEDKQTQIESKTSKAGVVGAILLDGGIVDMMTGAMWEYPETVEVAR